MRERLKAMPARFSRINFNSFGLNSLLVFLAYLGMTVVLTYPVAFRLGSSLAGMEGDSYQHLWSLWWAKKALLDLRTGLDNVTYLYYPLGTSHKILSVTPLIQVTTLPLLLLVGPVTAYNIHFLLAYALSGLTMYWLCLDLIDNRWAAFISGTIFAFAPTHLIHGIGHFAQIITYWFPLYALFAIRLSRRPSWKNAIGMGVFLALSSLVNIVHIAYFVLPFTIIWLLYLITTKRSLFFSRAFLGKLGAAFMLALLITSPFFLPFILETLSGDLGYFSSSGYTSFSCDLLGFIAPSPHCPLVENIPAIKNWSGRILTAEGGNLTEGLTYLGIVPLVLALTAVLRERRRSLFWMLLCLIAAVLSLGPLLKFNGNLVTFEVDGMTSYIPLPYALLMELPFYEWGRVPGRLATTTVFALAVLVGYGSIVILSKPRSRMLRSILGVIIVGLICLEYWVLFPYPTSASPIPDFYSQLRAEKEPFAVLDYPVFTRPPSNPLPGHNFNYPMYYQTYHEHPIVGGYIWRWPFSVRGTMKAVNNLVAPEEEMRPDIAHSDLEIKERVHWLDWYNIRYVVLHHFNTGSHKYARSPEAIKREREFLETMLGTPVYEDELITAFEVSQDTTSQSPTPVITIGSGWYGPRSDGDNLWRWKRSIGDLFVYSTAESSYRLEFTASSYRDPRHLSISVNDQYLTTMVIDTPRRFVSPEFVLPAGKSTIWFETDSCIRPANDGRSGDTRCLSIQVTDLELVSSDNSLPPNPVNVVFGDHLSLLGYDLAQSTIHAGSNITLTLFWEATESLVQDWSVFTHVLDQQNQIVAQKDNMPVNNQYPTSWWAVGEVVQDEYVIHIPEDTSPGTYRLNVGLYLWQTGERLIISDTEDDHVLLAEIEVLPTD